MKKKLWTAFALVASFGLGAVTMAGSNDPNVYVNGQKIDTPAFIKDDLTYIPLRAVSEAMGAEVSWDGDQYSAFVNFTEDEQIAQIVENVSPSVVAIVGNYAKGGVNTDATAHGTGVVIKSSGVILTNAHVVDSIKNMTVVLSDGTSYPGQLQYIDETSDLAVVKINKLGLKPIAMGNIEDVTTGKRVVAIGTPISLTMRNSATQGIISGTDVPLSGEYYHFIQTDAAINGGNSGGPLINMKGEMIAINSQGYAASYADNVNFSIPIDTVKYVLDQFESYGKVMRPNLGITLEQSWEANIGLPTQKGLTVKSSTNPSLKAGDEIQSVNGIMIHNTVEFNEAIKDTYTPGDTLQIKVLRDGAEQDVEAGVLG